jgi:tRNA A37 threonylcarbamoyladenosine synthetase subunit TsaC/SUA5/YrdC
LDRSLVYLVQTDTTAGFLSDDPFKLSSIKKRSPKQKILREVDSLNSLNNAVRVPKRFKKFVRGTKYTSLIYPNGESYRRIPHNLEHHRFISKFSNLYSTSANETGKEFNLEFAQENSDIILYNKLGFFEGESSKIYKVNNKKIKRLR